MAACTSVSPRRCITASASRSAAATRHGKPLVALVSASGLERLEEAEESPEGRVVTSVAAVHDPAAAAPREHHRFGIAAEHRGPDPS